MYHFIDSGLTILEPDEDWRLSNPYWIAYMSDGMVFYQNDNDTFSAWLGLKDYINKNKNKRISRMVFKFRSHEINFQVPDNSNWIYFAKAVGKEWTEEKHDKFFVIGLQTTDTMLDKYWYKVPELTHFKTDAVALNSSRVKQEFLIFMPILEKA